ncbi:YtxH domain-containing protein [Metabacillus halosaccharovorans]|uniref:YtxH domain-containing protein n=1 Tax=Metabacillus halosaccharovorans TaxID=930124 RepID=UPI00203BCD87|nr:YtxH domain-containing protein [Metabacillus halosaccharovorans]MCM3442652.1 YtxH domain-containing protein [Metabacillus halosaccharovorans]
MTNGNKLVRGMLVGAIVGAVVSLLDKKTRDDVITTSKNISSKIKGYVEDPTVLTNEVRETIDSVKDTVQEVSEDITFINEKVKELKETTPQVMSLIQETKERFIPKRD